MQAEIFLLICFCFFHTYSKSSVSKQSFQQTGQKQKNSKTLMALQYNILNHGQSIKIPLQSYFPFSSNYSISCQQSTENISQILNINFNLDKIQVQASVEMKATLNNGKQIDMSKYRILDVKTIYNQPNKLFLLENNVLMMYSYREKSESTNQKARVIYQNKYFKKPMSNANNSHSDNSYSDFEDPARITLVNITQAISSLFIKNQNFSCIQTQAMPFEGYYKLIVLCKMQGGALPLLRNYIVTFDMEQDNRGFITNLVYNSSNYLENRFGQYSAKRPEQTISQDQQIIRQRKINQSSQKQASILSQKQIGELSQKNFNKNKRTNIKHKIKVNQISEDSFIQSIKRKESQNKSLDPKISLQQELQNEYLSIEKGAEQLLQDNKIKDEIKIPSLQICQQYHIKYFDSLVVEQKKYSQAVIVYCNYSTDASTVKQIYQVTFKDKKVILSMNSNLKSLNITNCLLNNKFVAQYQNGFVSVIGDYLFKYSHKTNQFNRYQSTCESYNSVPLYGYVFITSRNQSGVETIYIIYKDRIIIFESFSPNYQTLIISATANLTLVSYSISNQILSLHYENKQQQRLVIMAYNIKAIYPHLIDKLQYQISTDTGIYLFSVMNYLENGNYFFIYERQRNLLNLTYYDGQYVNISIKDSNLAIGNLKLSIANTTQAGQLSNRLKQDNVSYAILPIFLVIRCFSDTQIQIVELQQIKVNNKLFNIDLVKAIIGPLGRFYKMSNFLSLQFVNSFHQIDIYEILSAFQNKNLLTFSVNTFLKDPMLTFYFENFLILNCDLEFNYDLMKPMISRCVKITDTQTEEMKPSQIIIYEQGRFLQHQGHNIEFCRISSNIETFCLRGDFEEEQIKKIKLIKYYEIQEGLQFISIFIIFKSSFKQKDYIKRANATTDKEISVCVNVQITQNELQYLKNMQIRSIEYDEGYHKFLMIYMFEHFNPVTSSELSRDEKAKSQKLNSLGQTDFHIVQIYSKPQLQSNQTSHFIGHLVRQFISTELSNVFIIDNRIIMLSNTDEGSSIIEQFIIQDFKCIHSRMYPLYGHGIVQNGSHSINSGFLFVEVQEPELSVSKYLVYDPKLNSTNILTHSFEKSKSDSIMFTQKITPSNNVMAIMGTKLFTLSLPNMVIKLSQGKNHYQVVQQKQNQGQKLSCFLKQVKFKDKKRLKNSLKNNAQSQQILIEQQILTLSDNVNVSFIDNNDILKILNFKYSYDISDSKFQYDHRLPSQILFQDVHASLEIQIDPTQITGPVSYYNIQNSTFSSQSSDPQQQKNICEFIQYNSSDIFTKTRCIKYYNAKQDGLMQDFLTYDECLYDDYTIIVTDRKILCIENMKIRNEALKNKTKDCSVYQEECRIFLVCIQNNRTTMNLIQMKQMCSFSVIPLPKPEFLKYNLFKMIQSGGHAIFQVPIRSQQNKIYYVTQFFQNNTFSENYVLLKHQSQQQFFTKDFTTYFRFMFLLQNGLGIYNLTKRNESTSKTTPDVWITNEELKALFNGNDEQFSYVNCLNFDMLYQQIILQIGTSLKSYQIRMHYGMANNSIKITNMTINYIYRNPWSCYNTLLSKSRYYKNMTIKMCSFMPQQHYIFSNFIPITENKQNSYIIFYEKNFQKNQSYPFRMDIIYTNIYSNDNFQLPNSKGSLLIGSLFNLLCQYDLRDSYKFTFTLDPKIAQFIRQNQMIQTSSQQINNKQCHFYLNLSNQNYQKLYPLSIKLNFNNQNNQFWTDWKHWIQRVVFAVIVANFIRLQFKKRSQINRVNKAVVKKDRKGSNNFDQEFDVQVRFHSSKKMQ